MTLPRGSGREAFYRRRAEAAGLRYLQLNPTAGGADPVDPRAADLLGPADAHRLELIPVAYERGTVLVAVADPSAVAALAEVERLINRALTVGVASPEAIAEAQQRVYGSRPPVTAAAAQPLGELLVETGLVTPQQVAEARVLQHRTGIRLGQALVHSGAMGERELSQALADQLQMPGIDVSAFEPDRQALALLPEPTAREHRVVPLAIRNRRLVLAISDPLDARAAADIRREIDLPIEQIITSRRAVERLLQRVYGPSYVRIASTDLLNRAPEESAFRVLSRPQKLVAAVLLYLGVVLTLRSPIGTVIAFNIASIAFYLAFSVYKLVLMYRAISHDLELPVSPADLDALDDRDLPVYTILVPLYREAAVAAKLVNSIAKLDYPRAKLDVKLIVEEDDDETIDALRRADLPPHFKLVVVPDALPKTKPKACNYGLIQAEGEFVVIYDAEDRPDADQLKRVIVAFSKAEERIVCIQCKLNYFNRTQNILTRWFTSEYSNWFDLLMPGLDASDAPIPLGGTSNHFRRETLLALGAWDPFNVTEDADLGVRLHKAGYKTAIIDSTTYEEANSDLYNWIRQRSRWVKGYIQTWLVHMRHPVRLWRELGGRGFFSFQMVIGGTFFSFLVNPFYWVLTTIWLMTSAGLIRSLFPSFVYYGAAAALYVGNFTFTYVNVVGSIRRRYFSLVKYALLSPLYWALMSIGAWKGLIQLIYRPYYWEKTVHGLDLVETAEEA